MYFGKYDVEIFGRLRARIDDFWLLIVLNDTKHFCRYRPDFFFLSPSAVSPVEQFGG